MPGDYISSGLFYVVYIEKYYIVIYNLLKKIVINLNKRESEVRNINMGIFDKFKKTKNENYKFAKWLDSILENELPNNIKAINFNLYEDGNNKWSIELIGSSSFDEKDEDWACDEVFSTRDNPFVIIKESNWENIEKIFTDMVKKYLDTSKNANKLKKYMAIGIGFVDGNLNVIYKK